MAKGIMIIDGQRVPFDGEKNVLAVIRKAGIDIPTFCYYSELSTYGACRMCMVEDVKTGKLDASCSMEPRDGMEIRTNTALCGLGQSACKPVVSTLRYFRDEYLAHVVDHHCPICNGRKRRLVVNAELCKGCGKCKRNCPMEAISGEIRQPHVIDNEKCIHCGACWGACPFGAIDAIEED